MARRNIEELATRGAQRGADAAGEKTLFVEDLAVGVARSRARRVTQAHIEAFADISGDRNPLHLDAEYAAGTRFGGVVAHGMIAAGLISAVIGEDLPGHGAVYLGQTLKFLGPVRPGDLVEARCEVTAIDVEKRRLTLACEARVGDAVVLTGEARVLAPSRSDRARRAA